MGASVVSVYAKVWAYKQHPLQVDSEGKPKPKTKNPAAKAVLVALAEFPGIGQRECWPAQETLALMTDFEERTVRKHLAVLEDQGFIKRTERRKQGRRLTDMVTLLGSVEEFGPSQEPPERHAKSHRNVMPGNRKEEPSGNEELANARSSGKPQSVDGVKPVPLEQYVTNRIYAAMLDAGYRWAKNGDKSEYGYHLGRVKDMLSKDDPSDEELEALPDFFVEYYEAWNPKADAVSALREMRRSRRREEKPRQQDAQTNGHKATPAEAIEYVFANSRSDSLRNSEAWVREAMHKHDFTSGGAPPYPIMKTLGGTDNEQHMMLSAIQSLIGRWQREAAA